MKATGRVIPEAVVEAAWADAAQLSARGAEREMDRVGREQPELLAFVLASTERCSPAAHELAAYLCFVIVNIFRRAGPRPPGPVPLERLQQRMAEGMERLTRMVGADPRFLERLAPAELQPQPAVIHALVDALLDAAEDDEEPLDLDPEETGMLYLVLRTVVEVLDEEWTKEGTPSVGP